MLLQLTQHIYLFVFQIIDDSEFENTEQFELTLSDPAMMTRIGPISKALVLINGPNDGRYCSMQMKRNIEFPDRFRDI